MKIFLLLVYALSLAFAPTSSRLLPASDAKNNPVKRVEGPEEFGREDPGLRPRPVPVNAPALKGNHDGVSVPEVVGTKPKFPYKDEPFVQDQTGKKDPAVGETVLVNPLDALPGLAKFYLGLDDEAYAKALASHGWLQAAVEGRQYSTRSNPTSVYDRQRAIGREEYLNAVEAFGMERKLPSTWESDNGWWRGVAVDLEDEVTMSRYRQTMQLRKILLESPRILGLQFADNTGSGGASRSAMKRRSAGNQELSNALPPIPVDGGPLGHTLLESPHVAKDHGSSKLLKRQNPLSQITNQGSGSSFVAANNTNDQSAEFQTYLAAFRAAQSNASDLIFPFLDTMLNGTNSSIVYDAAWSIYSDLTGSSPIVLGPFMYGMHCLDWIEDQIFGANPNVTAMSDGDKFARNEILAFHSVLLDLYYYAWDNSLAALNKTGLLDDMTKLAGYLTTNDTAVMGAFANYKSPAYNSRYFTVYNATLLPDSAYGKLTS